MKLYSVTTSESSSKPASCLFNSSLPHTRSSLANHRVSHSRIITLTGKSFATYQHSIHILPRRRNNSRDMQALSHVNQLPAPKLPVLGRVRNVQRSEATVTTLLLLHLLWRWALLVLHLQDRIVRFYTYNIRSWMECAIGNLLEEVVHIQAVAGRIAVVEPGHN
jgi:hypothetical protein